MERNRIKKATTQQLWYPGLMFKPCHSTSTVLGLLDVSDYILKNIDEGNLTGAVFLDLSKAFDIIDHSLLKIKLALAWCDNYLPGRTQSVSVN